MKIVLKIFKWMLILIVIGVVAYKIYEPFENRKLIRNYLNIPELPSVSSTDCHDYGFTDVLVKCYFEIDPKDYPALMKGRIWSNTWVNLPSEKTGGPVVGSPFTIREIHQVNLVEEKHGGAVTLWTDSTHHFVLINFYVE